jgi:CHAT domain-containing protein
MICWRQLVWLFLLFLPATAQAQPDAIGKLSDAKLVARLKELCPAQKFAPPAPRSEGIAQGSLDAQRASQSRGEGGSYKGPNDDKLTYAKDLMAAGQWETARSQLCEELDDRYHALGMLHIWTITAVNELGIQLRKGGRGAEARALFEGGILFLNDLQKQGIEPFDRPLVHARLKMRMNLASSLYEQRYYAESIKILEGLIGQMPEDPSFDANAAESMGLALGALGRLAEAEPYLRAALDIRLGDISLTKEVPSSITSLGANLSGQGRYMVGERLLRQGRKLRIDWLGADHLNTAFSNVYLASNLIAQGRFSDALPIAEAAVATRQSQLPPLHPDRAKALSILGNVRLGLGDSKGSLAAAREASNLQISRSVLDSGQAKFSPLISPLRRYEDPHRLLVRSGWASIQTQTRQWETAAVPAAVHDSFVAAQRLMWSSTGDAIAHTAARRIATEQGLGKLAEHIETLRDRVAQLDAAAATAAGSTRAVNTAALLSLEERRDQAIQQLNQLAAELQKRFPAFFAYLNPEPVRISDLQKFIQAGEVVILIIPGQASERGFIWAVTHDRVGWAEIPIAGDTFVRMVRHLRLVIDPKGARSPSSGSNASLAAGARGYDRANAFLLYQRLFSDPAIAPLVNKASRWLVVPQGDAVSLPLAALVTRKPMGGRDGDVNPVMLRRTHWLAFQHELSLLPTISSIASLRGTKSVQSGDRLPFFGLGDPDFRGNSKAPKDTNAYFSDGKARLEELRKLARLPGTRTEIETLARTLGGGPEDVLLGSDASEAKLTTRPASRELNRYAILAFATHGLVTGNLANTLAEPALALTPPLAAGGLDDGLLTASEASLLRLNAEWVLLSACNSAAGGSADAEGLTGLARAFLLAGARAVLVSHWRVRDDVAPQITGRTIALMHSAGLTRGKALQQAMRELMMNQRLDATASPFATPSAWAAFALVGID